MPLLGGKVKGGKEAAAATPATGDEPPMAISAAFDTLWVSEKGQLSGANIAMKREGQDWRAGRIEGRIGPKPLHILIDTDAANQRHLSIDSEDAGGVFKAFGIYEDMVGGVLSVKGSYDDSRPGKPLTGTAHVSEFTVVGAPVLARLLTVASFNGIIDLLNGDGIAFSSLDAPFSLSDGLLELHDARSFGNALGLTAKGQIDLDNDRIAMEGTIVPAYMLNSLLGNIPLLGGLITGDEGSGIFAATYSIKGTSNAPEVSVNPLATLAPGVLRKLFQIFDSNATNARPQSKSTP